MRHGFLLVHKPAGPTSHDIVSMARKALNERHIGHLGTLDPAAEGLLVLAVGRKALKVVELFEHAEKSYEAGVTFGCTSSTYDREGKIESVNPRAGWRKPDFTVVNRTIKDRFTGQFDQIPPAYSAIKVGGERAYRKMRQGKQDVELKARPVKIKQCDIVEYKYPRLSIKIDCGSGTYIRSLAHDLGQALRCGGYLSGLKRTRVGDWDIKKAHNPDTLKWTAVMPLKDVLASHPKVDINEREWTELSFGRPIERPIDQENTIAWFNELPVAILIRKEKKTWPRKVL